MLYRNRLGPGTGHSMSNCALELRGEFLDAFNNRMSAAAGYEQQKE